MLLPGDLEAAAEAALLGTWAELPADVAERGLEAVQRVGS